MAMKIGKAIMILWWMLLGMLTITMLAMKVGADMNGMTVTFGTDLRDILKFVGVYFFAYGLMNWDEPIEVEWA